MGKPLSRGCPRPPCPWCGASMSRVSESRHDLQRNVYRRRRRCVECGRLWPTFEMIDLERFIRELRRQRVTVEDVGLAGQARVIHYAAAHARAVAVPVIAGIVASVGNQITADEACALLDAEQLRACSRVEALLHG